MKTDKPAAAPGLIEFTLGGTRYAYDLEGLKQFVDIDTGNVMELLAKQATHVTVIGRAFAGAKRQWVAARDAYEKAKAEFAKDYREQHREEKFTEKAIEEAMKLAESLDAPRTTERNAQAQVSSLEALVRGMDVRTDMLQSVNKRQCTEMETFRTKHTGAMRQQPPVGAHHKPGRGKHPGPEEE